MTKQYCFEKEGVPAESEYLEVRYAVSTQKNVACLFVCLFVCLFPVLMPWSFSSKLLFLFLFYQSQRVLVPFVDQYNIACLVFYAG